MQLAARNVAMENSRLRMLLSYRDGSNDEIDKFHQTFPHQTAAEVAKATISESAIGQQPAVVIAAKVPLNSIHLTGLGGHVISISSVYNLQQCRKHITNL